MNQQSNVAIQKFLNDFNTLVGGQAKPSILL